MLEILSSLACNFWEKSKLHINTDFEVTVSMLCVIYHIHKNEKVYSDSDNRKQVKNVIKTLFRRLSEDEMYFTLDLFLSEYADFDNKNSSFDGDEFIWKRKYIRDGNSHLWHQKYSLPCTKVLGFVACRVTSKILGIGATETSWGDVKTIYSVKICYQQLCIRKTEYFYTYAYI